MSPPTGACSAPCLLLNWVVGPALMFTLAWVFLPDLPEYRTGLIIVGLARCIAMVLIWNDLAGGDREAAVVLVALNSLFQIVAYSLLGYFYLKVLPAGWARAHRGVRCVDVADRAHGADLLGCPVRGWLSHPARRRRPERRGWYEEPFLPRIGPVALWGLLFTVVILFALQGGKITNEPLRRRPHCSCRSSRTSGSCGRARFVLSMRLRFGYPRSASVAFTAAGNNFELGIAVAISVFGVTSGQALAGVVGPLIEVPVLVGLVYVALWARHRFAPLEEST